MTKWLSSVQFADIAGLHRRSASRILEQIESGDRLYWQGFALEVRVVHGRGGNSGKNTSSKFPVFHPTSRIV
jgi:hypothetical protein